MNIKIIEADIMHAELIGLIHAKAWKEAYEYVFPKEFMDADTAEARQAEFLNAFINENSHYFLVYKDESAIGIVKIVIMERECELLSIYFLQNYCGKGIGSVVMDIIKQMYSQYDIVLWVLECNVKARAFYEKNGFIKTGKSRVIKRGLDFVQIQYIWK